MHKEDWLRSKAILLFPLEGNVAWAEAKFIAPDWGIYSSRLLHGIVVPARQPV